MRYVKLLRTCSRVIALTAMVAGVSMTAQAAEPATLTLACQGTVTNIMAAKPKPEPVSMGIIVNFTGGTVTRQRAERLLDDLRQHRPRDRRRTGGRTGVEPGGHLGIMGGVLPEMHANTTDVLGDHGDIHQKSKLSCVYNKG